MANFYKQNEDGEYIEADDAVDELFREKSDEIVRKKLKKAEAKETERIRSEIEEDVRKNATEVIKGELKSELEATYKPKLEESQKQISELSIKLRRKTIAAEYGFKTEAEEFLGDGDEDEMRAKADILKKSFAPSKMYQLEKQTTDHTSEFQKKTGIKVKI